jgi:hypothetical protein
MVGWNPATGSVAGPAVVSTPGPFSTVGNKGNFEKARVNAYTCNFVPA